VLARADLLLAGGHLAVAHALVEARPRGVAGGELLARHQPVAAEDEDAGDGLAALAVAAVAVPVEHGAGLLRQLGLLVAPGGGAEGEHAQKREGRGLHRVAPHGTGRTDGHDLLFISGAGFACTGASENRSRTR